MASIAITIYVVFPEAEKPFAGIAVGMSMDEIEEELCVKGDKSAGKMEEFFPPFFGVGRLEAYRVWCNDDYCVTVYFDTNSRKATKIEYYSTKKTALDQVKQFLWR
jgi:hypothetical protein